MQTATKVSSRNQLNSSSRLGVESCLPAACNRHVGETALEWVPVQSKKDKRQTKRKARPVPSSQTGRGMDNGQGVNTGAESLPSQGTDEPRRDAGFAGVQTGRARARSETDIPRIQRSAIVTSMPHDSGQKLPTLVSNAASPVAVKPELEPVTVSARASEPATTPVVATPVLPPAPVVEPDRRPSHNTNSRRTNTSRQHTGDVPNTPGLQQQVPTATLPGPQLQMYPQYPAHYGYPYQMYPTPGVSPPVPWPYYNPYAAQAGPNQYLYGAPYPPYVGVYGPTPGPYGQPMYAQHAPMQPPAQQTQNTQDRR